MLDEVGQAGFTAGEIGWSGHRIIRVNEGNDAIEIAAVASKGGEVDRSPLVHMSRQDLGPDRLPIANAPRPVRQCRDGRSADEKEAQCCG
jgi:hypothetical protein